MKSRRKCGRNCERNEKPVANSWDELYGKWLQSRADCEAASEDLFSVIRPVVRRGAKYTASRFRAEIDADDLEAGFYHYLYKSRPPQFNEAYIRKVLYNLAIDEVRKIRRKDTISIDQDRDGEEKPREIPEPPKTEDWPWFESLHEPVRGYGALFSHIQRLTGAGQGDAFSKTGWFSGVSGESVRSKFLREAEWARDQALRVNPASDWPRSGSAKVTEEAVRLLNAEMLGTHSALTIFVRALCARETKAPNPFSPENVEVMSRAIGRAPDAAVRQWVIACMSGVAAAAPEPLANCAERVLADTAGAEDIRYFLDCASLYLFAYSILILLPRHDDPERHWTAVAAPMTPRISALRDYRTRAKGYSCLEEYLPTKFRGGMQ
jgi:hypothetical protein